MEEDKSILFTTLDIDSNSLEQLEVSSKWSRFIGSIYFAFGIMIVLMTVTMLINMNEMTQALMQINGMSDAVLEFIKGFGKWLFLLFMILMAGVMFINAYFLIKFKSSVFLFITNKQENELEHSFSHLANYLKITTILSIFSMLSSIIMIAYELLK
jgi:hypothetical protein